MADRIHRRWRVAGSNEQPVPISELFPPRGISACVQQRLAEAQSVGALNGSTVEHVRAEVVDLQTDADRCS